MKQHSALHIILILVIALIAVTGCSTQKNTARNRWLHAFHSKYNIYYNGTLAYIDASLEKEQGNKDNYTEIIPLYTVGNKNSRELGKGNYDRAIEKCQKAIQRHSIKQRPEWNKSRRKTAKDIEWLNRREYNPFIWKAWMLMGRSQFYQGDFENAASTFAYMSRLFETQPAIYGRAKAWLAKCYIEQNWMYDAEDIIRNMQRDSIHWRAQKEWDYTYTDYYIHTQQFDKAIPYLRKVIKHEMRRKQKAREWYLMGQLQAALGRKTEAYKAFKHVIRLNPPYELEFNARISMSEVMASTNTKQVLSRLRRMAASDKNKEYLDQLYYAMGNIYLLKRDTLNAISSYEKGNTKSTRNGIEKGVLLLHLGDLYWVKELYSDARRCYGEAIGLLDKDRKDYAQLSERSKVLDELVPYTEAVHLQDSLQQLATMSESDRNAAIDRVITLLKKKEKEERNQQAEENAQRHLAQNGGMGNTSANNRPSQTSSPAASKANSAWYFYNPIAVSQGKTSFQRQWGKRENVDNWQRINKTVVASAQGAEEMTDEMRDSLAQASIQEDSIKQIADSAQNDPHKREYYLAQIPFTAEQLQASNALLTDGLYHSGVIFKDKLDNLPLSEKALRRIEEHFKDYEHMDDVLYHLYLLYSRKHMPSTANTYVERLKQEYPESKWTTLLTDPYYADNAKFGVHIEDSLYAASYEAFKLGKYQTVLSNSDISSTRFPMGANRDKFIFIGALSKLNQGDAQGCVADMKTLVEKYPEGRLSEMAGMIVNGVNAGKRLHGGKFDLENVWERRSTVLNENEQTAQKAFSPERQTDFVFLFAYQPDSVNENQLLFEMAKFNFTTYLVRNFDINIEERDGIHLMQITGFRNYDEARLYAHDVLHQTQIVRLLSKSRTYLISQENLSLLGTQYAYSDYDKFYLKHFAPVKPIQTDLLDEPAEIITEKEESSASSDEKETDENPELEEQNTSTTIVVTEEKTDNQAPSDNTMTIPEEPQQQQNAQGTTIIKEETQPAQPAQGSNVIKEETQPAQPASGTIVIKEEPQPVNTAKTNQPAKTSQPAKTGKTAKTDKTAPSKAANKNTAAPKAKDNKTEEKKNQKDNKEKKEDSYDLEDEYFELEGF